MSERFISKAQAASIAQLCEKSIERAIAAGELCATRQHGRVVIDGRELQRWIASRQTRRRPEVRRIATSR